MKKPLSSRHLFAIFYALVMMIPAAAYASSTEDDFRHFTETFEGTFHCEAYDYDLNYTLVGDPDTREILFSAAIGSKVMVLDRRLEVDVTSNGLAMELKDETTRISVSAQQEDIDVWGDNVDNVTYFYAGSVVHARGDSGQSGDFFTAFHGACRLNNSFH